MNQKKQKPKSINFDLESYKDKNYLTHNFHAYPAKFVPQIPKIVIEEFTKKNDLVLDPFCGSGMTPLVCKDLGRNCLGCEINEKYYKNMLYKFKSKLESESESELESELELELESTIKN